MSDNHNNEIKTVKRGKTNGYNNTKLKAKRQRKFEDACDRKADHDCLTIQEKIDKARSRRGESKREIARLTRLLEAQGVKVTPPKPVKAEVAAPKKKAAKKVAKKSAK